MDKPRKKAMGNTHAEAELKIYGIRACEVFYKKRPVDLVRVYIASRLVKEYGNILKFCAEKKLAYHIVEANELENVTESKHHEGLCFVIRAPKIIELAQYNPKEIQWGLLAVEEVENPHNVGAILRSTAHFGFKALIVVSPLPPRYSSALYRTAEGGAESVLLIWVKSFKQLLEWSHTQRATVYATTGHGGMNLFQTKLAAKTIMVLGSEGEGLKKETLDLLTKKIMIPGTGNVESLNVSTAAAVLMSEWCRNYTSV